MIRTDRDNIRVAETDEELFNFDVSDDTLEGAAPIVGRQPPLTLVFGTALDCGCLDQSIDQRPVNQRPNRSHAMRREGSL